MPDPHPNIALFTDPYVYSTERFRVSLWMDYKQWSFLKSLSPSKHDRVITINILVNRLIEALKKHGITEYNPNAYRTALGGLNISFDGLSGGTVAVGVAPESNSGHDGRRVDSVPQPAPDTQTQYAGPQSSHGLQEGRTKSPKRVSTKAGGVKG